MLQELLNFGLRNPKKVYVRNFNVNDPDLWFYIVDANGASSIQRCSFNAGLHPRCAWHEFGQAEINQLKQEILALPYQLVP